MLWQNKVNGGIPETMEVEEIKKDRWRATKGVGENYLLDSRYIIQLQNSTHYRQYPLQFGNYFRTKEQAERAKPYIQKALDDFWKEEEMKITIDTNTNAPHPNHWEKGERKVKWNSLSYAERMEAFSKDSNGIPSAIGKDKQMNPRQQRLSASPTNSNYIVLLAS